MSSRRAFSAGSPDGKPCRLLTLWSICGLPVLRRSSAIARHASAPSSRGTG